jgi:hypothetical protein
LFNADDLRTFRKLIEGLAGTKFGKKFHTPLTNEYQDSVMKAYEVGDHELVKV